MIFLRERDRATLEEYARSLLRVDAPDKTSAMLELNQEAAGVYADATGRTTVVFDQYVDGVRVAGARVVLLQHLAKIISTVVDTEGDIAAEAEEGTAWTAVENGIAAERANMQCDHARLERRSIERIWFIDPERGVAVPSDEVIIVDENGVEWTGVVDRSSRRLISLGKDRFDVVDNLPDDGQWTQLGPTFNVIAYKQSSESARMTTIRS